MQSHRLAILGIAAFLFPPAVFALRLTPAEPAAQEGQTVTVTADAPVRWSWAPGSAGSFTPSADGRSLMYTAPAHVEPQSVLAGCQMLPNDTVFNTPVDALPKHPMSDTWTGHLTTGALGFDTAWGTSIGDRATPRAEMKFSYTPAANGLWLMPAVPALKREGGAFKSPDDGQDHHTVAVDHDACQFWEMYNNRFAPYACQDGSFGCTAQSGWTYHSTTYALPWGHGATDAAGMPIGPLTLHLSEVKANAVHHALRFTIGRGDIQKGHPLWPATGGNGWGDENYPPYGARFRLKSSFDIAGVCGAGPAATPCAAILTGLQRYGMFVADIEANGHRPPVVSVDTDLNQDAAVRAALGRIGHAHLAMSAFEAVDESSLIVRPPSARVKPDNGYVKPAPYAVVTAVARDNPGEQATVPIALQGVAVGLPSPTMWIMAGTSGVRLAAWVSGTSERGVRWSLESGPGAVTPEGLYSAPDDVERAAGAVLKATSIADPQAVAFLYATVMPKGKNPSGALRIDVASPARTIDQNGNLWLPDQGWQAGDYNPRPSDPPWPDQSNPAIHVYESAAYTYGSDLVYRLMVPDGNYKVRLMFGQPFNAGWGGTLAGCSPFKATMHAPIDLETQGQVQIHNFDFGALVNYQCAVPVDALVPAKVTDHELEIALRAVVPDGTHANPSPQLNGLEAVPDHSPPHLAVDPERASVVHNQNIQLYAVGWYMPNAVTWRVISGPGSVDANGIYSPPLKPVHGRATVIVMARSRSDPRKTARAHLTLSLGAMTLAPESSAPVVRGTHRPLRSLIAGKPYTNVRWRLSPSVGTIDSSGVYSAPDNLVRDTTVTVTAASLDEPGAEAKTTLFVQARVPAIRINCGAFYEPVTDEQGNIWATDHGFEGGMKWRDDKAIIRGADSKMRAVYASGHYSYGGGGFAYRFALPNGEYRVTLKFADYAYAVPPKPGYIFDVRLNGVTVLSGFDPDAASGGRSRTAVDRTFTTRVTDKTLTLRFDAPRESAGALINAIEIIPVKHGG